MKKQISISSKILRNIKNGTEVIFFEKQKNKIIKNIVSIIVNLVKVQDDYKFNLVDKTTGALLLKENGEPRVWMLKASLELGTIKFADIEKFKTCPVCGRKLILVEQMICDDCQRNEKRHFFNNRVKLDNEPFKLDDEQVNAILSDDISLVTARAGSGKTRVLTAKLIDLFFNHGLKQDEAIAFCFNSDAAEEIRKRLNSQCTVDGKRLFDDCDVVRTFHAFAVKVLEKRGGDVLVDDRVANRTRLIKEIIYNLRKNESFEKQLRKYFLSNTTKIDHKNFDSMQSYYRFVRNSRYRSLGGEQVRSIPEKIIADFLFEHNIKYVYEPRFYLNNVDFKNHKLSEADKYEFDKFISQKSETVPDFYLEDYKMVWEHWGITGRETEKEQIAFSQEVASYSEYKKTMGWKRAFWNNWRHKLIRFKSYYRDFSAVSRLIETNPDFFRNLEREEIEKKLKKFLESKGVKCEKLPEDEIMLKVWKNAEDYFTIQIRQFIDKFQQIYIDREDDFKAQAKVVSDDREKTFLRLGYMVYQEYVKILNGESTNYTNYKKYNIDFNQCLNRAAKKIRSGLYDDNILQLKWILIDEYQDFSELFFDLIQSILSRNPNIKLFCVGDDWQAINRFAGSDLKFFNQFDSYFPGSKSYNIGTNYRSESHVVLNAGEFMQRFGIAGKAQRGVLENSGVFVEQNIDVLKFADDISNYNWLTEKGGPWENNNNVHPPYVKAYIKFCSEIINQNPGKKIMILNRRGKFLGLDLEEIERILKRHRLCKINDPNIAVKTVHRAKGEEADIVILTEVDENHFPVFHQDSNLYKVFGENENTIMEDETRLYYVALTRSKKSVYILYSKDSPSCFLKNPIKNFSKKRFS